MGSIDHRSSSTMTRRSLFPSWYSEKEARKSKNLNVKFSPYARQKPIDCIKYMCDVNVKDIWWQKSDYDDFIKVSRIISKAMLEGGSEIWLLSKSPTATKDASNSIDTASGKVTNNLSTPSKVTSPRAQAATQHLMQASASGEAPRRSDLNAVENFHETRNEWWLKFGHSRRGLEHIASIGEGKQRHGNVRASIRAVLDEQKRQQMFLPNCCRDMEKLRSVYMQQTHWAKVLARAMGEADADAVRCNFDASTYKSREFFLKEHLTKDARDTENLPVYMQTVLTLSSSKIDLDVHTASQIRFRRQAERNKAMSTTLKQKDSVPNVLICPKPPILDQFLEEKKCDSDDGLMFTLSQDSPKKMAKEAAGFLGDESKEIDHLKILTGMGL